MQTVTDPMHTIKSSDLRYNSYENKYFKTVGTFESITCSNSKCKNSSIYVFIEKKLYQTSTNPHSLDRVLEIEELYSSRLLPFSEGIVLPDFIPKAISDDYKEACKIKELSPKASATLIRRCLQGMIRDFCGISKSTLYLEINELQTQVEAGTAPREISIESVDAIDATRKIGNIGAHMEKDVNEIIDVEANEAQCLIELVETLLEDWYIARENRKQRFSKPIEINDSKEAIRQNNN